MTMTQETATTHTSQVPAFAGIGKVAETYQVLAVSTGHISEQDNLLLLEAANDPDETMVMGRKTGYFIKLYADDTPLNYRHGHSEALKRLIRLALEAGFQMIELDADASMIDGLDVFDW
ncbi:DUF5983 family protein [Marinobacter shengliensis]|uniref:DUF5983 family protein n=1 Tax=Marinobacter shengliensis TaxID=1389223 RepID=UPI0011098190|nr:DUF5983 family protein [Marinobacter shengliensis]